MLLWETEQEELITSNQNSDSDASDTASDDIDLIS
jgi:hypothetical protein